MRNLLNDYPLTLSQGKKSQGTQKMEEVFDGLKPLEKPLKLSMIMVK